MAATFSDCSSLRSSPSMRSIWCCRTTFSMSSLRASTARDFRLSVIVDWSVFRPATSARVRSILARSGDQVVLELAFLAFQGKETRHRFPLADGGERAPGRVGFAAQGQVTHVRMGLRDLERVSAGRRP